MQNSILIQLKHQFLLICIFFPRHISHIWTLNQAIRVEISMDRSLDIFFSLLGSTFLS